jgi:hypothetical protein
VESELVEGHDPGVWQHSTWPVERKVEGGAGGAPHSRAEDSPPRPL